MGAKNRIVLQRLSLDGDWYSESCFTVEKAIGLTIENLANYPESVVRSIEFNGRHFVDVTDRFPISAREAELISISLPMTVLRAQAKGGIPSAQDQLGLRHYHGAGVPEDYAEAVKWWSLAADQGYARSEYGLGHMYENGLGVPVDYAEAVKWYRLAAENGRSFRSDLQGFATKIQTEGDR
jgi:TPR repeat protein